MSLKLTAAILRAELRSTRAREAQNYWFTKHSASLVNFYCTQIKKIRWSRDHGLTGVSINSGLIAALQIVGRRQSVFQGRDSLFAASCGFLRGFLNTVHLEFVSAKRSFQSGWRSLKCDKRYDVFEKGMKEKQFLYTALCLVQSYSIYSPDVCIHSSYNWEVTIQSLLKLAMSHIGSRCRTILSQVSCQLWPSSVSLMSRWMNNGILHRTGDSWEILGSFPHPISDLQSGSVWDLRDKYKPVRRLHTHAWEWNVSSGFHSMNRTRTSPFKRYGKRVLHSV